MNFKSDSSIDGKLVYGYEKGWHWSKNKGGYNQGRDFFWVHLEVGDRAPLTVKLHVESPRVADDPELNAIKKAMVTEFLSSKFQRAVEQAGYEYKASTRSKPEHIEKSKCTSPFHILLTKEQDHGSHQANIEMVNKSLGVKINEVIEKFKAQLQRRLSEV